jgi:hypothetical protein
MAKRLPYNETNDKKQDAKTTRGLDKEEKTKFKKMDDAHGKRNKPETQTADRKIDEKIVKKIKTAEKRHESKEGPKGEKLEDKREKKLKKK